jgi:hypothetical protein
MPRRSLPRSSQFISVDVCAQVFNELERNLGVARGSAGAATAPTSAVATNRDFLVDGDRERTGLRVRVGLACEPPGADREPHVRQGWVSTAALRNAEPDPDNDRRVA